MRALTLDGRLSSVGKFVRRGAVLADIGTDHGYLPLFLLGEGVISFAHLADINAGPLASAKRNASEQGMEHLCAFHLTDGAAALVGLGITDYSIAGMGGELIVKIIDEAPHLSDPGVRLILQPMSREHLVREYLARVGFAIVGEDYSLSAGKYYLTIAAEYTGIRYETDPPHAYFGELCDALGLTEQSLGYLRAKARAFRRAVEGLREGHRDFTLEASLYDAASEILKRNGEEL